MAITENPADARAGVGMAHRMFKDAGERTRDERSEIENWGSNVEWSCEWSWSWSWVDFPAGALDNTFRRPVASSAGPAAR